MEKDSCSERLTKKFEEHLNSDIDKVIDFYDKKEILGEYTIVIRELTIKMKNILMHLH